MPIQMQTLAHTRHSRVPIMKAEGEVRGLQDTRDSPLSKFPCRHGRPVAVRNSLPFAIPPQFTKPLLAFHLLKVLTFFSFVDEAMGMEGSAMVVVVEEEKVATPSSPDQDRATCQLKLCSNLGMREDLREAET
ncbi:hypothetical protein BaRGS_00023755 [Batillaria attramentaria]|uniref:Uncharacterized protein n=1 Tax=Batillaria attramentaria TaxID=370345 RepID=A0ABD0KD64_9CAEN